MMETEIKKIGCKPVSSSITGFGQTLNHRDDKEQTEMRIRTHHKTYVFGEGCKSNDGLSFLDKKEGVKEVKGKCEHCFFIVSFKKNSIGLAFTSFTQSAMGEDGHD